jgi:hypothetical protein
MVDVIPVAVGERAGLHFGKGAEPEVPHLFLDFDDDAFPTFFGQNLREKFSGS